MANLFQIEEYLYYWITSFNKYKIHSPFVYKLVTEVFEKKMLYADFEKIEKLRDELKENDTEIDVIDLGAGSKTFRKTKHVSQRKISKIARKSVKKEKYGHLMFMMGQDLLRLLSLRLYCPNQQAMWLLALDYQ